MTRSRSPLAHGPADWCPSCRTCPSCDTDDGVPRCYRVIRHPDAIRCSLCDGTGVACLNLAPGEA